MCTLLCFCFLFLWILLLCFLVSSSLSSTKCYFYARFYHYGWTWFSGRKDHFLVNNITLFYKWWIWCHHNGNVWETRARDILNFRKAFFVEECVFICTYLVSSVICFMVKYYKEIIHRISSEQIILFWSFLQLCFCWTLILDLIKFLFFFCENSNFTFFDRAAHSHKVAYKAPNWINLCVFMVPWRWLYGSVPFGLVIYIPKKVVKNARLHTIESNNDHFYHSYK